MTTYPDVPSNRVDEGAMPPVGFWDPWGLAELGSDETMAWFRHAELKHGRVAMAAVTGWCVTVSRRSRVLTNTSFSTNIVAITAASRLPPPRGASFPTIPSIGSWHPLPGRH